VPQGSRCLPLLRVLLIWLSASVVLTGAGGCQAFGQTKIVHILGWSDYIDPRVFESFWTETGIKATYDSFSSEDALEKELSAVNEFDVAIVPARLLQSEIVAGRLQKFDKGRLSNSANLWPEIVALAAAYDPGNQYAIPYMWFTAGFAYNAADVREISGNAPAGATSDASAAPGAPSPFDSWAMLFRPENLKKFSSCGVEVFDSPNDLFPIALRYLGLNPTSVRPSDIKHAADLLSSIRRSIKKFEPAGYADALVDGDICVAIGSSLEGLQARERARAAANGIDIGYAIPKEGAPAFLDTLVIPKNAQHPDEAYALIDFLLRPRVAAANSNYAHLANSVLASKPLIDKNISSNPSVYPDATVMQRLFAPRNYDGPTQKIIDREWERVKSGK